MTFDITKLNSALSGNPLLMMGLGGLSGNVGRSKRGAFANSMGGALQGMQMANLMGIKKKQQEQAEAEYKQKMADEHQKRLQAAMMLQNANPQFVQQYFPAGAQDPAEIRSTMKDARGPAAQQKAAFLATPEAGAMKQRLMQSGMTEQQWFDMFGAGGTTVNVGGGKTARELFQDRLPTGYTSIPDPTARAGFRAVPMTGVGEKKEAAGTAAMLEAAQQGLPVIEDLIFGGDPISGEVDRGVLFGKTLANIEIPFTDIKPIPGALIEKWDTTKGGQLLASMYEKGIQGITRIETGAAMPDTELDNTRSRFEPGPGDSIDSIREKYIAYKIFVNDANSYLKDGFVTNPSAEQIDWNKLFKEAKSIKSNANSDEALIQKYLD